MLNITFGEANINIKIKKLNSSKTKIMRIDNLDYASISSTTANSGYFIPSNHK